MCVFFTFILVATDEICARYHFSVKPHHGGPSARDTRFGTSVRRACLWRAAASEPGQAKSGPPLRRTHSVTGRGLPPEKRCPESLRPQHIPSGRGGREFGRLSTALPGHRPEREEAARPAHGLPWVHRYQRPSPRLLLLLAVRPVIPLRGWHAPLCCAQVGVGGAAGFSLLALDDASSRPTGPRLAALPLFTAHAEQVRCITAHFLNSRLEAM